MFFRLGASLSVLRERTVEGDGEDCIRRRALEILVRKVPDDQEVSFQIKLLHSPFEDVAHISVKLLQVSLFL